MQKRYIDVDEFATMLEVHCGMVAKDDNESIAAKAYRLAYKHVIDLLTNPLCNNYLWVDEQDGERQNGTGQPEQGHTEQPKQDDSAQNSTGQPVSEGPCCDADGCYIRYD